MVQPSVTPLRTGKKPQTAFKPSLPARTPPEDEP